MAPPKVGLCLMALTAGMWLATISAAPIPSSHGSRQPESHKRTYRTRDEHTDYLRKFGHWKKVNSSKPVNGTDEFTESVKSLQRFAGLKPTGVVDNETTTLMNTPRCQNPDNETGAFHGNRTKRFATISRWQKNGLSYYFLSYASNSLGLNPTSIEQIWRTSLNDWSSVSQLTFSKTSTLSAADIKVLFASGDHGDGDPFDGPGGVLAHAFFPVEGRIHFDDSESWSDGTYSGINLRQVTTHEMGHILGLAHSTVRSAVMYPYYSSFNQNFRLDADDIIGIQYLYGAPVPPSTTNLAQPSTASSTQQLPSETPSISSIFKSTTTPPMRSPTTYPTTTFPLARSSTSLPTTRSTTLPTTTTTLPTTTTTLPTTTTTLPTTTTTSPTTTTTKPPRRRCNCRWRWWCDC